MDKKINLIPTELSVSKDVDKISKALGKISLVLFIFTIVLGIAAVAATIFYNAELNKINQTVEKQKQRVEILKGSETQLVLAKDRISKIDEIRSLASVQEGLDKYAVVSDYLAQTADINFSDLEFDSKKAEVSYLTTSSSSVINFLKFVSDSTNFASILMNNIGYNPASGYSLNLVFESAKQK